MAPLISVLIPAYNVAGTLDEALASIACQTLGDWQAICVDDGSSDATGAILDRWARADSRFQVIHNGSNLGIVASLNRAIERSEGRHLARMDGDDVSHPERFAAQAESLARLEPEGVGVVGCLLRYFPEEAVADGARRYEAWLNSLLTPDEHARERFIECPIAHPSMLLSSEAVRAVGGYEAHGWPEDYDLLLRLHEAGYGMAKVDRQLLKWREHPHRTSRNHADYHPATFYRCKAHYLRRGPLAEDRPALLFGGGPVSKALGRALLDEGVTILATVDVDPRRIGQRIQGRPVISHEAGFALRGQALGLTALGRPEARAELREKLRAAGWREGTDYLCAS